MKKIKINQFTLCEIVAWNLGTLQTDAYDMCRGRYYYDGRKYRMIICIIIITKKACTTYIRNTHIILYTALG